MNDEVQGDGQPEDASTIGVPIPDESLHGDERGVISVFFVFGLLALVLLFGVLFDTAKQTTRKVEMQGAADASAVTGGAYVARGMNLIVFNNCGMADILAVQVTVHSYLMALNYSNVIIKAICAGLKSNPYTAAFGVIWETTWEIYYNVAHPITDEVDEFLSGSSGVGWETQRAIDVINQGLKPAIGPLAALHAFEFATDNGAERQFLLPQESDLVPTIPSLPIDRGPQQRIADRAEDCPAPALSNILRFTMLGASLSFPIMIANYEAMLAWNWSSLQSDDGSATGSGPDRDEMIEMGLNQALQDVHNNPQKAVDYLDQDLIFGGTRTTSYMNSHTDLRDQYGSPDDSFDRDGFAAYLLGNPDAAEQYVRETRADEIRNTVESGFPGGVGGSGTGAGTGSDWEPLEWPDDPPKPMVLDVDSDEDNVDADHEKVAKYLRYLSVTWAEMRPSPIGPDRILNRAPYGWMTYGQANVYNPTKWDMFSQDWRVKLVPAEILDEKFDDLRTASGVVFGQNMMGTSDPGGDWTYVNNH